MLGFNHHARDILTVKIAQKRLQRHMAAFKENQRYFCLFNIFWRGEVVRCCD